MSIDFLIVLTSPLVSAASFGFWVGSIFVDLTQNILGFDFINILGGKKAAFCVLLR